MENGEEDEEGVDDERDDVGERGEGERHLCSVLDRLLSEEDLMSVSVFVQRRQFLLVSPLRGRPS